MKTVNLYLYRHGNTFNPGETVVQVGLKSDLPLTAHGQQQAYLFVDFLNKNNIYPTQIYSGFLKRQTNSAKILHDSFSNSVLHKPSYALNEIDYGDWEGLTTEDIQHKAPIAFERWSTKAEWPLNTFNGSLAEHLDALSTFIHNIYETHNDQENVIIISSNGIIRLFLYFSSMWEEITQNKLMQNYKVNTGHFCEVQLCSAQKINVLTWNNAP